MEKWHKICGYDKSYIISDSLIVKDSETGEIAEGKMFAQLEKSGNVVCVSVHHLYEQFSDNLTECIQQKDIKRRRYNLRLSQLDVANYVGVTKDTLSRWERNPKVKIKQTQLNKLAEILQVEHIITTTPQKSPEKQIKEKAKTEFKKVRRKILSRDKEKCTLCGEKRTLEVHHIISRANGGTNDENNLITLCRLCHIEKHKDEPIAKRMRKKLLCAA